MTQNLIISRSSFYLLYFIFFMHKSTFWGVRIDYCHNSCLVFDKSFKKKKHENSWKCLTLYNCYFLVVLYLLIQLHVSALAQIVAVFVKCSCVLCCISPALLILNGYWLEFSTSSSSCSSITLHCRRYGVSFAGFKMRVSLCRTPSTRSHSSSCFSSSDGDMSELSSPSGHPPAGRQMFTIITRSRCSSSVGTKEIVPVSYVCGCFS